MARTKYRGSPSIAVHALPVANIMESAIRMQETRLRYKKVHLPMPLHVTESAADRALVYYTTTTKIGTEGQMVPFRTCLSVLTDIRCLSSVAKLTIKEINQT